ncbi:hypothetical protein ACLX1H_002878 [Fusarium chlamydosporum]
MQAAVPDTDSSLLQGQRSRIYQCLPSGNNVRLLEILPGVGRTLRCKLHVYSLESKSMTFEALSYTWGDGTSSKLQEVEITTNGSTSAFKISNNLNAALRALRRSDVPRLVWADAICINQKDSKERGQQVRMMGQIFSRAFQVVIWLGEDDDCCFDGRTLDDSSLSSFDEAFSRTCSLVNEWLTQSNRKDMKATYSKVLANGYSISQHSKNGSDMRIDSQDAETADQSRLTRSKLLWLFKRRWFSRVWVIQESVLARHAVVQFGSYQISWHWVGIAAALIVNNPTLTPDGLERETIPTGVSNAYLMYRLSESQIYSQRLMLSLAQLLQVTRQFQCKEPRDKVYGLLGLHVTDSIMEKITPDYSSETSTEKIYEDVARLMLESESPLRFLSSTGTFGEYECSGPSWIPSWHRPRFWTILPTESHQQFRCGVDRPMKALQTGQTTNLLLEGVIVDRIETYRQGRPPRMNLGFQSAADERWAFLSRPRWSEKAWTEYAMTLTCGGEGRGYAVNDVNSHLADFAAALLSGRLDWAIGELMALDRVLGSGRGDVTHLGYLETVAKTGDAGRYVRAVAPVYAGYRMFVTKSGRFGIGPVDMEDDDQLCVLFGAEVPFLLRPKGNDYLVVGECYVDDVMQGNIIRELASNKDGPLKATFLNLI